MTFKEKKPIKELIDLDDYNKKNQRHNRYILIKKKDKKRLDCKTLLLYYDII